MYVAPPPPYYYPAPPTAPPRTDHHLGIGYKAGNGLGLLGADLIISPIPHLVFDLQVNRVAVGTAQGVGIAPAVQFLLRGQGQSTVYFGAGYLWLTMSNGPVTASGSGGFGTVGYQWLWDSGFSILLGGGLAYVGELSRTEGSTTVDAPGGLFPAIEFSVRYLFL